MLTESRLILPADVVAEIQAAPYNKVVDLWQSVIELFGVRGKAALGRVDRFYLLTSLLHRPDAVHPWLYERCREVEAEPDECLDLWSRGHYKALSVDQVVPTLSGWKSHGDLIVGDQIYGPDGKPCAVIAKTQVWWDADCFKIGFDDGTHIIASASHLWSVMVSSKVRVSGNTREKWKNVVIDTAALAEQVHLSQKFNTRPYPWIPTAEAIEPGVKKELSLDPYVLGAWLGDGAVGGTRITAGLSDADEMQQQLELCGVAVTRTKHSNSVSLRIGSGICGNRMSSNIANALRSLGVYKDKRIPPEYQLAPTKERWSLLQGLMDTDGSAKRDGQCMFVSAKEDFANDVYELCGGLGLKATCIKRLGLYKNTRRPFWQVQFRGTQENPPFRMNRKIINLPGNFNGQSKRRKIISVDKVESVPVSCIQVDRQDGLYVVGRNFVTTHNSTIITFAGIIQEILNDQEITVAILCYVKGLSAKMLGQIKTEFENNEELKQTYPDVLWANPRLDAPREGASWTQYRIDVKRATNPKEGTLEAHGLTDGMPTGAHFALRVYDDVVVRESTTSPEMINKTTECWELSDNLKSTHSKRRWHIGTRYHFGDTYGAIMERKVLRARIYPATDDGTPEGKPVFLTQKQWDETKITQRTSLAAQMLQNPSAGNAAMFRKEDLRFIDIRPATLNVYIMADPASSKKKGSDSTAIAVIGVDAARNKYLLDGYRQKMNLQERWTALLQLRRHWLGQPGVQAVHVGYERFGMRSDMEYFEECMQRTGESFPIAELAWPQDGAGAKSDRIQRLVPDFARGKFYLPAVVTRIVDGRQVVAESARQTKMREDGQIWRIIRPTIRRDHEGTAYSMNKEFLNEYLVYPFSKHDDILDACSRIYDMNYQPPVIVDERMLEPEVE